MWTKRQQRPIRLIDNDAPMRAVYDALQEEVCPVFVAGQLQLAWLAIDVHRMSKRQSVACDIDRLVDKERECGCIEPCPLSGLSQAERLLAQ